MSEVHVIGRPTPQGSLRAMRTPSGAIVTPQDKKVLSYRGRVQDAWIRKYGPPDHPPTTKPVRVTVEFAFHRPGTHYLPINSKRRTLEVKPSAPVDMVQHPDVDKLARAVLDALTGLAFKDDKQVVEMTATKRWSNTDTTHIYIEEVQS